MGAAKTQNLTLKQERFCLVYMETGNATEAYRQAYDVSGMKPASINRKAKEMLDNGNISARLLALRAPAIKKAQISLETHLKALQDLRDAAAAYAQYSAAITAETNRGKASGLYTEKVDVTGNLSLDIQVVFGGDDQG
jgi:phage terminase small subunit